MELALHIAHYFEKEAGPLLNICNVDAEKRSQIIQLEKDAKTGFNRFSYGEEFFDFRLLADDLLMDLYESKYGSKPARRPFYAVLGDADVVGGLYRDPFKIIIPVSEFAQGELTFMCPDHFHLVSLMNKAQSKKQFGYQIPSDFCEAKYPYFGKLMTYEELTEGFHKLKIDQFLQSQRKQNGWYRYVEAQIWSEPEFLLKNHGTSYEVTPEPWTHGKVTHLQNYKKITTERCNDGT